MYPIACKTLSSASRRRRRNAEQIFVGIAAKNIAIGFFECIGHNSKVTDPEPRFTDRNPHSLQISGSRCSQKMDPEYRPWSLLVGLVPMICIRWQDNCIPLFELPDLRSQFTTTSSRQTDNEDVLSRSVESLDEMIFCLIKPSDMSRKK